MQSGNGTHIFKYWLFDKNMWKNCIQKTQIQNQHINKIIKWRERKRNRYDIRNRETCVSESAVLEIRAPLETYIESWQTWINFIEKIRLVEMCHIYELLSRSHSSLSTFKGFKFNWCVYMCVKAANSNAIFLTYQLDVAQRVQSHPILPNMIW